jgi:hypothetical protein
MLLLPFHNHASQENNGLAVINLKGKDGPEVVSLLPLGMADYSVGNPNNNALDPSDSDNSNNDNSFNDDPKIRQWPVFGMYQPDEIEAFNHRGATYLVLANEGDARAWGSFREDKRLRSFTSPRLDRTEFPNFADLEDNKALGRLQISTVDDTGSEISSGVSTIRAFGARSFSILRMNSKSTGYRMVYNSGSLLENLTSTVLATSTTGACPTSPSTKRGVSTHTCPCLCWDAILLLSCPGCACVLCCSSSHPAAMGAAAGLGSYGSTISDEPVCCSYHATVMAA